ncbi:hypothetical protein MPTK1_3g15480 [Marchantia polymorpha subsp. ruderalis]|uniref:Uncharacterized protein n=2 Tax=Marchantia polymorpha TaxID=3197 RepID=A0AAF6B142_MARPO|nr:hypothetical protein MARPO_0004s0124 [Marchantia polymorpha]BBN05726.1 hypothetical protein Mp_3g15480 [Marchantia polymorpha subsp. ruderalis]|eukprot:PTQ48854.1 hypothetical protein MARPO_0004s0124 [Marchantia polymorpha]
MKIYRLRRYCPKISVDHHDTDFISCPSRYHPFINSECMYPHKNTGFENSTAQTKYLELKKI